MLDLLTVTKTEMMSTTETNNLLQVRRELRMLRAALMDMDLPLTANNVSKILNLPFWKELEKTTPKEV